MTTSKDVPSTMCTVPASKCVSLLRLDCQLSVVSFGSSGSHSYPKSDIGASD